MNKIGIRSVFNSFFWEGKTAKEKKNFFYIEWRTPSYETVWF